MFIFVVFIIIMLFAGRKAHREQARQAMVDYVYAGLELLQGGDTEEAREHFSSSARWAAKKVKVQEAVGRFRLVSRLASERDLVDNTAFLAGNSAAQPERQGRHLGTVIIAKCAVSQRASEPRDPDLVSQLGRESAIIAAEEWLHLVQRHAGRPLAGISMVEADVAAHLDNLGIELSTDYVTRYPERATWYVSRYPEHEAEVRDFSARYPLRFGPSPS